MATAIDNLYRSDFNLDFVKDILWRDHAGDTVLWLMNPSLTTEPGSITTLPFVSPDWHVKAAAEFERFIGGDSDILWQNDSGALALWQMGGSTITAITELPNPGPTWHVVGDNDFDRDFGDDILFQNDNGSLAIWTEIVGLGGSTNPDVFACSQNPGPTWHVVGTGDTNDDQVAGILWQHDSGALALWENPAFVAGTITFTTAAALPTVDRSWHAKGMADLDGDVTVDNDNWIVFQNDNGAVAVWDIGGANVAAVTAMNLVNLNPGPSWHIVGMRDMDNDGRPGILFQNDNGAAAVWENYQSLGGGMATFNTVLPINPNPNPNGHVWDLL